MDFHEFDRKFSEATNHASDRIALKIAEIVEHKLNLRPEFCGICARSPYIFVRVLTKVGEDARYEITRDGCDHEDEQLHARVQLAFAEIQSLDHTIDLDDLL